MRSHFDPDYMNDVAERVKRIRDYVPAEEFDVSAATMLAKRELPDTNLELPPPEDA